MPNHRAFVKFRWQIVALLFLSINVLFYLLNFRVDVNVDNAFYDSDSARTLSYVYEPRNAISSVRPMLYLFSWIPHLLSKVVSPYIAWTSVTLFLLSFIIHSVFKIFGNRSFDFYPALLVFVNNAVLSWIFVPDTFVLGSAAYIFAIRLYTGGSKYWRVISSGILASCFNLFLIIPWMVAHIYLGRDELKKTLSRAIQVALLTILMAATSQFFAKFKPVDISPIASSLLPSRITGKALPLIANNGFLSSIQSLGWIHSPVPGAIKNSITYLVSPWTFGYHYSSEFGAIQSPLFPPLILILGVGVSMLSFFGIVIMRVEYPRFTVFAGSLEAATCMLYLFYSTHPVLFAPFLFVTRIPGLIYFIRKKLSLLYPLLFLLTVLNIWSFYLVY